MDYGNKFSMNGSKIVLFAMGKNSRVSLILRILHNEGISDNKQSIFKE